MSGSDRVCIDCGLVIETSKKRYVYRERSLCDICNDCADGRRLFLSPSYNLRPLGYPKIQGGKQAPGKYEWSD